MKILVAIDGSASSLKALQHASTLFAGSAAITLINVQSDEHLRSLQGRVGKSTIDEYLIEQHDLALKDAKAWLTAQKLRYDVIVADGYADESIAEHAHDGEFAMIVIGSKGRGSFTEMLVGSLVTRLAAVSKVPLLVVPA